MFPPRPTHLLHLLLKEVIHAGDIAIDATAGNGHDTLFLAEAVGDEGKVIAMDIQPEAIASSRRLLEENSLLHRVELLQESHANINRHASLGSVAAIVFNLGYLPGANHEVITQADTTIMALQASVQVIKAGGVLAVICYPGHEGGDQEALRVEAYLRMLEQFRLAKYELLTTKRASPFLLLAWKKQDV